MTAFLESREGRRASARIAPEARDFMHPNGGWHVVGRGKGGTVGHHGAVHPDEYVDEWRLFIEAQHRLGFNIAEVWEAYGQGRKPKAVRDLRDRIDARLLAIADAGGSLAALARIFEVDDRTFHRAVARARKETA